MIPRCAYTIERFLGMPQKGIQQLLELKLQKTKPKRSLYS